MGYNSYEKHYLFRTGKECCSKYFPGAPDCPYEDETQLDYYWTNYQENKHNLDDMPVKYNHTYYPDLNAGTCINGTDYPPWMSSDKDFKRLYLFKNLDGCCRQWFTSYDLEGCVNNVIQGAYEVEPCSTNRPDCDHTSSVTDAEDALVSTFYIPMGFSFSSHLISHNKHAKQLSY